MNDAQSKDSPGSRGSQRPGWWRGKRRLGIIVAGVAAFTVVVGVVLVVWGQPSDGDSDPDSQDSGPEFAFTYEHNADSGVEEYCAGVDWSSVGDNLTEATDEEVSAEPGEIMSGDSNGYRCTGTLDAEDWVFGTSTLMEYEVFDDAAAIDQQFATVRDGLDPSELDLTETEEVSVLDEGELLERLGCDEVAGVFYATRSAGGDTLKDMRIACRDDNLSVSAWASHMPVDFDDEVEAALLEALVEVTTTVREDLRA